MSHAWESGRPGTNGEFRLAFVTLRSEHSLYFSRNSHEGERPSKGAIKLIPAPQENGDSNSPVALAAEMVPSSLDFTFGRGRARLAQDTAYCDGECEETLRRFLPSRAHSCRSPREARSVLDRPRLPSQ